MSTIKEFNRILNASTKDRFEKWQTYRDELTEYIINNLVKDNIDIHIFGAGNCDDINLEKIDHKTNKIVLSDIDLNAMNSVFGKYQIDPGKVTIKETDYTGFNLIEDWNDYVNCILKLESKSEIKEFMDNLFQKKADYQFLKDSHELFDAIVLTPIYTQLLLPQFMTNISILNDVNYDDETLTYLTEIFLELIPETIELFNKNIFRFLKKNGIAIILSDIFEANLNTHFYKQMKNHMRSLTGIDSFHQNYQRKYGIGLGDYGLMNAETFGFVKSHQWFEWPFSNDRSLFVKAVVIVKD